MAPMHLHSVMQANPDPSARPLTPPRVPDYWRPSPLEDFSTSEVLTTGIILSLLTCPLANPARVSTYALLLASLDPPLPSIRMHASPPCTYHYWIGYRIKSTPQSASGHASSNPCKPPILCTQTEFMPSLGGIVPFQPSTGKACASSGLRISGAERLYT